MSAQVVHYHHGPETCNPPPGTKFSNSSLRIAGSKY